MMSIPRYNVAINLISNFNFEFIYLTSKWTDVFVEQEEIQEILVISSCRRKKSEKYIIPRGEIVWKNKESWHDMTHDMTHKK